MILFFCGSSGVYASNAGIDESTLVPVNNTNSISFTLEEKQFLQENPVIRFGIDPLWAPIEFTNSEGDPQGMSVEYLQQLEIILGIKFEFVKDLTWSEAYEKLKSSQIDILPAISITPQRTPLFNFTSAYLSTPNAIFSATDRAYIGGPEALKGKKVAIVRDYAIKDWLVENYPEIKLVAVSDLQEAISEVNKGTVFAYIGNLLTTSYYIGQTGLTQVKVVGETAFVNNLGIGVRKDWKILADILQKGFEKIEQKKRNEIYYNWISIEYAQPVDYTIYWTMIATISLILLTILYWNYHLKEEILHRKKIEKSLKLAQKKADQATKEKESFIAQMSHELRTPLNSIIGIEYLFEKTKTSKIQKNYLSKMKASSTLLLALIDNILSYSKTKEVKPKLDLLPFNINDLLKRTVHILGSQAQEKSLELQVKKCVNLPEELIGDEKKLQQILINLISNAIKYTTQGRVTVFVDMEMYARDPNLIKLIFTVKDTGIGINKKQHETIFEPFSQINTTAEKIQSGTGLGLTISKQFVQLMSGELTVNSVEGEGSEFTFTASFKICHQRGGAEGAKESAIKYIPSTKIEKKLKGAKVLLVDDNQMNLFVAEHYLGDLGIIVFSVSSGKEALNRLEKEKFDAVLLDIQMPVMDGYDTTKLIRKDLELQDIPIIAVTAHAFTDQYDKCIAVGMNDYLHKPIDPIQLKEVLEKWVGVDISFE